MSLLKASPPSPLMYRPFSTILSLLLSKTFKLQRFLGLVNFYCRFDPHAAAILRPLTNALIGAPKSLTWTSSMSQAFHQAQQALSQATLLAHPHPTAPISLATDASDSHIGGVLQQFTSHHWQPLSLFSAKHSPHSWAQLPLIR